MLSFLWLKRSPSEHLLLLKLLVSEWMTTPTANRITDPTTAILMMTASPRLLVAVSPVNNFRRNCLSIKSAQLISRLTCIWRWGGWSRHSLHDSMSSRRSEDSRIAHTVKFVLVRDIDEDTGIIRRWWIPWCRRRTWNLWHHSWKGLCFKTRSFLLKKMRRNFDRSRESVSLRREVTDNQESTWVVSKDFLIFMYDDHGLDTGVVLLLCKFMTWKIGEGSEEVT